MASTERIGVLSVGIVDMHHRVPNGGREFVIPSVIEKRRQADDWEGHALDDMVFITVVIEGGYVREGINDRDAIDPYAHVDRGIVKVVLYAFPRSELKSAHIVLAEI